MALLVRSPGEKAVALENPFVGLKSMTEADADRFFGRNDEIATLIDKLKLHRLVAVVADSGAGKSSLAQAGLIPAFRGGKLSDIAGREPDDRLWHVVVMRPGRDPIEGLKRGVTERLRGSVARQTNAADCASASISRTRARPRRRARRAIGVA